MQQLNKLIVVLFVQFYSLNAANLGVGPVEDTTDSIVDIYDPSSDETFDPQKDYADFKSSYEKLYQISGSPYIIPSMQQKSWPSFQPVSGDANIDTDESTNPIDITQDANDLSTTIPPQIDQQTTMKFFPENAAIRSMNDFVKSTQRPTAFPPFQPYGSDGGELLKRKPSPMFDSLGDTKTEDDLVNETGNSVRPVIYAQNESNLHNESADYVNDEAIETNYSQPITSIPYAMETTITSLPSSPVFISTRPPTNLFSSNPLTSTVSAATAPTDEIVPNQSVGKKSKKIEALPRIYKYSADEIVRKYLDDTFLRAPLATLINTAPEPLRKAKILWKSALRPNTPVDIVLVAFNSSGKHHTFNRQKIFSIIISNIFAYNKLSYSIWKKNISRYKNHINACM